MGRRARGNQAPLDRHHRDLRFAGDHAARLSRPSGHAQRAYGRGRVLQPPRIHGGGKNLLRVRIVDSLDHDGRPVRRTGPREPRLREVHHRVGDEHDQHQPARLAVHPRSAEERREDRGHRPRAHAHGQAGGLARRHQAGHRRRARAGHDERHHRRGFGRLRLRREIHARLRGAEGARRELSARTRCRDHRHPGGRHPEAGARICDDPAIRHSPGRGDRKKPRRRPGHPRDHLPSGPGRRLAARGRRHRGDADLGIPDALRPHLPAGLHQAGHARHQRARARHPR